MSLSLAELLDLTATADDAFVGRSPSYRQGRVYGGQVVAQALRAACHTVAGDRAPHSMHANFVLPGRVEESILYRVDRVRDGRAFTTRRVIARQGEDTVLELTASFHRPEDDAETPGLPAPAALPQPESLPRADWECLGDVRVVPLTSSVPPRSLMWLRSEEDLGDDPVAHACALAYLSDHNPVDAIAAPHPDAWSEAVDGRPAELDWDRLMTASLDHALWIHRPFRADEWLLFDLTGHGLAAARGLAMGTVHTRDGRHVASLAQEGLVRRRRP